MRRTGYLEDRLKRTNKLSVMLNRWEMKALSVYRNRYRVKNKSEFLREIIIKAILKRFEDEHPTLWEKNELTLFSPNEIK